MAIKIEEHPSSRQGTTGANGHFDFVYMAWGDAGETVEAMQTAVLAAAPSNYTGLPRGTGVTRTTEDGIFWKFVVPYGISPVIGASGGLERRVEIGGQMTTLRTSRATVGQYWKDLAAVEDEDGIAVPHFGGLINVNQDGTVDGVQAGVESFDFTLTVEKTFGDITARSAYETAIVDCMWHVNDATFDGFDPGEVLLRRASGQALEGTGLIYRWVFEFSASRNVVGLELPGLKNNSSDPHTIDKKGWEYLWTRSTTGTTLAGGKNVYTQALEAAVVDRVYEEADFSVLA